MSELPLGFDAWADTIHAWARGKGFYDREILGVIPGPVYHVPSADPSDGPREIRNPSLPSEKLMLIVTEVAEVMEARRDGDEDHEEEEVADILIRTLDYAAYRGFSMDEAVPVKMDKNRRRRRLHGRTF